MHAFTLIELLIVVGIIAILALIAIPNFLEASVRAKRARVLNDLRVIAGALEAYAVDNNHQLLMVQGSDFEPRLYPLTSPIAYVSSLPLDPFGPHPPWPDPISFRNYYYVNLTTIENDYRVPWDPEKKRRWLVASSGPDRRYNSWMPGDLGAARVDYDATNGTVSGGDMFRFDDGRGAQAE